MNTTYLAWCLHYRADSTLELSGEGKKGSQSESESIKDFTEDFIPEPLLTDHESDIDPLFEINIGNGMEDEEPLLLLTDYNEVELPVTDASPDISLQDADLLKKESSKGTYQPLGDTLLVVSSIDREWQSIVREQSILVCAYSSFLSIIEWLIRIPVACNRIIWSSDCCGDPCSIPG